MVIYPIYDIYFEIGVIYGKSGSYYKQKNSLSSLNLLCKQKYTISAAISTEFHLVQIFSVPKITIFQGFCDIQKTIE